MFRKVSFISSLLVLAAAVMVSEQDSNAQQTDRQGQAPGSRTQRQRYDEHRLDAFFGDWRESNPKFIHGSIVTRDMLTQGDPVNPPKKGAVLKYAKAYVYGTMDAYDVTTPETLKGEQEIYFFLEGEGTMTTGKETTKVYPGVAILMPANLEFTLKNTGSCELTMFIVTEPIPEGFRVNKTMLVRNENTIPIASTTGHWTHIVKYLFETEDGLGTLERILTVTLDPMTIADAHSHGEGTEEVWTMFKGETLAFLGRQIRKQTPGVCYMIPADNSTGHTNINHTSSQAKFFYWARYRDHEVRE